MSERTDRGDPTTADRMLPPESPAGAPFWAASRERRLLLPWCVPCGAAHWYPRGFCPVCLGDEIEWRPASGGGRVHAVSVQPKVPFPGVGGEPPYAVALVDLDEGVRMMLRVVADDAWSVAVDDAVSIGWEPLSDGRHLPVALPSDPPA
ncbi:MAG: DNA-binding protein [Acidimicrobiales bacterium]|nr:DNA-binding protein [Acidimicrobiales bacterium]